MIVLSSNVNSAGHLLNREKLHASRTHPVQIGSTILRSECMTTLRVVCATAELATLAKATMDARTKRESFFIEHS